jgi:hypothetical protein
VLACAIGFATGIAVAGIGSLAAKPPYGDPSGCDPEPDQQQLTAKRPGEPMCGSRQGDRLKATQWGSHHMAGYQGNDVFHARNRARAGDEIVGGSGRDTAYIDANDRVVGVEVCKPIRCPKPSAYLSRRRIDKPRSASQLRYPAYQSKIECRRAPSDQKPQMWFLMEPQLRPVDATPGVDWQTVAWSPALYKLEGTQWVLQQEGIWLFDRTSDATPVFRPYENWWRRFSGDKERWFQSFKPTPPGTYQVRLRYHWYATGTVPEYTREHSADSVNSHYSSDGFEGPTHQWCVFP